MALSNTSIRIIVSIVAIPLILVLCLLGGIPFFIFVLAIGLISFYEYSMLVKNKKSYSNLIIGLIFVLLIILNSFEPFIEFEILTIFIVTTVLIAELFRNKESAIHNTGATLLGIFYIGLFSSTILKIREFYYYSEELYIQGGFIIISILATIWICDSAAFFLGTAFGKHKLFPRVSPNKSWEGAVAGLIFSLIAIIASKALIIDFLSWQDVIMIGLIIGTIGQIGDLVESLFKRDANVKDSSAFIPGHGGIFDRFDSLLFSAPVIYLYLLFFVQ